MGWSQFPSGLLALVSNESVDMVLDGIRRSCIHVEAVEPSSFSCAIHKGNIALVRTCFLPEEKQHRNCLIVELLVAGNTVTCIDELVHHG